MSNQDERNSGDPAFCPFCGQQMAQRPPLSPFMPPFMRPYGPEQPFRPQPPFVGPPSQGPDSGPPSGPPPSYVPRQSQEGRPGVRAIDPGAIRPCTFRYVYIWLENGRQFWAWLVFVGPRSAAGWRWNGRRWVYFGIDLDRIESFICI